MRALILLFVAVTLQQTGLAQTAQPRYSITISAANTTVKAGREVRIHIVQNNTTDKEQPFWLEGNPAYHGEYLYLIDVRQSDGKKPSRSKYFQSLTDDTGNFRGGVALNGGLVMKKPGEAITSSIDLNELYELTPGKYAVQVYQNDSIAKLTVKSNIITVNVTQ